MIELNGMIDKIISKRLSSGDTLSKQEIVEELLKCFPDRGHSELDNLAHWYFLKARVTGYINALKEKQDDDQETFFSIEGFKYIQSIYTVKFDGEAMLVRLDRMTKEQIEHIIEEKRRQAKSRKEHADELQTYLTQRNFDPEDDEDAEEKDEQS